MEEKREGQIRTHSNTINLRRISKRIIPVQGLFPKAQRCLDSGGERAVVSLSREMVIYIVHSRDNGGKIGCCAREELSRVLQDLCIR